MAEMLPLIYDCDNTLGIPDCDVDDGLTLLYLLGSPGVKLLAVTCSFGNSTQEKVFHNTVRLLREWGREDILVLRGGANPANRRSPAAEFLADAARRYPDRLAVLATGSLTNLLGAESYDPDFFGRVARISLMGGVTGPLLVGGRPMAELNCSVDAQAAHGVLTRGWRGYTAEELAEMLRFANAAAAIVTTRRGALRVMPTREEIDALLARG